MNNIHFDTVYANNVTDDIYDPYNCVFDMKANVQYNVGKIHLKSLEMPIAFDNIRSASNLDTVRFILTNNVNSVGVSITIPSKNYATINEIITALNAAVNLPNTTIVFNVTDDIVSVAVTSTIYTSMQVSTKTALAKYILGFNKNTVYSNNNMNARAGTAYCLNVDNYISMYISNVKSESTSNSNYLMCSFKIPLPTTSGDILFYNDQINFAQSITLFSDEPIYFLKIIILDRFGNQITKSSDYSFTLAFEKK